MISFDVVMVFVLIVNFYLMLKVIVPIELDFLALIKVRVSGLLCLMGEHICQSIKVIHVQSMEINPLQWCDIFTVCLYLDKAEFDCMNSADEMTLSINWQQQRCFKADDSSCLLFRNSYNTNKDEKSIEILRFTKWIRSNWLLRMGMWIRLD